MFLLPNAIGLQFILQIVNQFLMNTGHYNRNLHSQLVNLTGTFPLKLRLLKICRQVLKVRETFTLKTPLFICPKRYCSQSVNDIHILLLFHV